MDGITARILKVSAQAIANSLAALFNVSLDDAAFPSDWKEANGFRCSNLVILVFSLIVDQLPDIAKALSPSCFLLLSIEQFANACSIWIRPGHSIQDLLLKVTEDWNGALDHEYLVSAVFIDLSKAFDSLDHSLLLARLSGAGFNNNSLQWFTDYLSCPRQYMVLYHTFSDWATLVRGVLQGSVLGPLLFYMNDVPGNMCHFQIALFAGDITIYVCYTEMLILQSFRLTLTLIWLCCLSRQLLMGFSISKC